MSADETRSEQRSSVKTSVSANDVGRSFDCKTPGCDGVAKSDRGPYCYCDRCRSRRGMSTGINAVADPSSLLGKLNRMRTLARQADRARTKAEKLTREALAAKREADRLSGEFQTLAREMMGRDERTAA